MKLRALLVGWLALAARLSVAMDDCVSNEAEPLLRPDAPGIAEYDYRRESARVATEQVALVSGEKISLQRSGCAHFVIEVRASLLPSPAQDRSLLLAAAGDLLEKLIAADPKIPHLPGMLQVIRSVESPSAYRSGEPLTEAPGYSWVTVSADDGFLAIVYDVAL